jgi:hypothetical protein
VKIMFLRKLSDNCTKTLEIGMFSALELQSGHGWNMFGHNIQEYSHLKL